MLIEDALSSLILLSFLVVNWDALNIHKFWIPFQLHPLWNDIFSHYRHYSAALEIIHICENYQKELTLESPSVIQQFRQPPSLLYLMTLHKNLTAYFFLFPEATYLESCIEAFIGLNQVYILWFSEIYPPLSPSYSINRLHHAKSTKSGTPLLSIVIELHTYFPIRAIERGCRMLLYCIPSFDRHQANFFKLSVLNHAGFNARAS